MTTYRTIADSEVDQGSPITEPLQVALRDNPIAITEGATGAPRINPIDAMEHQGAYAAVGSYVLANRGTTTTAGTTYAGSGLRPSGVIQANAGSGVTWDQNSNTALSGTWRAMGSVTPASAFGLTLFLRIL